MQHSIHLGQSSMRMVKEASETGGRFSVLELSVQPGGTIFSAHLHLDCDQTVVGVEGLAAWTVGSELIVVGPGEQINIPRGTPHTVHNRQTYPVRTLCIYSPGCITAEFLHGLSEAYSLDEVERTTRIGATLERFRMLPVLSRN